LYFPIHLYSMTFFVPSGCVSRERSVNMATITHPTTGEVLYDAARDGPLPASPVSCIRRLVLRQRSLRWEPGPLRVVLAAGAVVRDGTATTWNPST
jgi:hypothetical protein